MTDRELSSIFAEIELKLIASLKRNLKGHKEWEKDLGFDWPAWQAQKIKHLERFRKENRSIMKEYRNVIQDETRKMLMEQYAEGQKQVETELSEYLSADVSDDSFFGIFNEKLESLIEEIQGKERTVEKAALRMTDDVYRQTILKADIALQTGSMTIPQAIEQAVRDFALKGINCIEYKNGRRVNIASYAEMALRTSNKRAQLIGAAKKRAELGFDTVYVSSYNMCSPTCLPWQGKAYIDDVFGIWDGERYGNMGKSKDGKWYLLLSVAIEKGLFHPNCRHIITSNGASDRVASAESEEEINRRYKLEQKQRKLERDIRKWKRTVEGTDDPIFKDAYKKKVRDAQKNLRDFLDENGDNGKLLRRDYSREKVYNFKLENPGEKHIIRGARYVEGNFEEGQNIYKDLGFILEDKREQFINEFIKTYSADKYEHMLIIDKDGYCHYVTSNMIDYVDTTFYEELLEDSYNIHTHPLSVTQFSFSIDADIPAMFSDGTKVMEACDTKYRYRFERPDNLTFEEWDEARYEVKQNLGEYMLKNNVSLEEFEEMKEHLIIKLTCEKLGINSYKRWKL